MRRGCEAYPNARFISAPSAELKRRLLREAQALLITSLAEETSSLVAMEAAASGTPVVAFRRGALAEVVREGVTGFLVEDMDEAVLALQRYLKHQLRKPACNTLRKTLAR